MDASQLNIIQPFDPAQQTAVNGTNGMNGHVPVNGMHPYDPMTMPMGAPPFGGMYPMLQQPMMRPFAPEANGKIDGNGKSTSDAAEPPQGGCCGSKRSPPEPAPETIPKEAGAEATGSCCSSKTNGTAAAPPPTAEKTNGQVNGNMPMFQPPPMPMPNGMYPFFATPNIFTYPPQYGSYMQPLQPEQWRQVMSNMNMAPQVQQAYMFGGQTPMPYAQNGAPNPTWTSHQCSCGESCQCIGCAAHPYNDATQSYVRSAWNVMMQDAQNGHAHANGTTSPTNGTAHDIANGNHMPQVNGSTAATGNGKTEGAISPTAPQTPSDATSGLAEEQALSANDFFFVSYPFTDGCDGEMSSCPCGDDCQCIGCAIHNNPGPDLVGPS